MRVEKNLKTSERSFDSTMLEINEMMEIQEPKGATNAMHNGEVLIRAFDCLVCLNNTRHVWRRNAVIQGRKLEPGESIRLIQE